MNQKREVNYIRSHPIAIKLYDSGVKPTWTHNIAEEANCG
jgi:hypothetical protein